MTIARRYNIYLTTKNGRYTIDYPTGSVTVTCRDRANRIFQNMTKSTVV